MEPAGVGCLQVQPIETIRACSDVQSEVGGEQVSMLGDAALATVNSLVEQLFLAVPAQAGLGQGGCLRVVLVETFSAGAYSLAAHRLYEHPRCPVPHTAREVLLPRDVIELLARDTRAVGEQPVGQRAMQRLTVLGQPAMKLGHLRLGVFRAAGTLPVAAVRYVGAIRMKTAGRTGAVLAVQMALRGATWRCLG